MEFLPGVASETINLNSVIVSSKKSEKMFTLKVSKLLCATLVNNFQMFFSEVFDMMHFFEENKITTCIPTF